MSFQTLGLSERGLGSKPWNANFRLSPGPLLAKAVSVWLACLLPFWLVTLVVESPVLITPYLLYRGGASLETLRIATFAVFLVMYLILHGALTYGVFQRLRGRPASILSILRVGLSRIGPVFLVALLIGMAVFAAALASGFFLGFLLGLFGLLPIAIYLSAGVALVVMTVYWVAVPAAVVEKPGAFASLRRSQELTEESRVRIYGVLLVLLVANYGIGQLVPRLLDAAGLDLATMTGGIVRWAILAPFESLGAVCAAVGYHQLRTGKEGVDVEELVRVFE